jgi:hypothetical protein
MYIETGGVDKRIIADIWLVLTFLNTPVVYYDERTTQHRQNTTKNTFLLSKHAPSKYGLHLPVCNFFFSSYGLIPSKIRSITNYSV